MVKEIKINPAPKTNIPSTHNWREDIQFAEKGAERKSHGPFLDSYIKDEKERETEKVKKRIQNNLQKGVLTESDEKALLKKWENDGKTPVELSREFDEQFNDYCPENEEQPDKNCVWKKFVPDGDLGITDREVPGEIGLSLRKHGWFLCHKNESPGFWESRYNEVTHGEYAPDFKEILKNYLGGEANIMNNSFEDIALNLIDLHSKKNSDYGNAADASYREFGLVSYIIRLNDKLNRLKSLTKPGAEQKIVDEKIEDTLMDLAAYSIMTIESIKKNERN